MELKDCTFGEHFQFPPHVEEDALGVKLLFKAAVTSYDSVNKEIDEMVIREIVQAAKDNGVTDLTILDRKFILEALIEKRDRMNGKEDVAPVAHGTWEEVEYDDGWCEEVGIKCSACGDEWVTLDGEKPQLHNFNYCPNCGAKMDGGTKP